MVLTKHHTEQLIDRLVSANTADKLKCKCVVYNVVVFFFVSLKLKNKITKKNCLLSCDKLTVGNV